MNVVKYISQGSIALIDTMTMTTLMVLAYSL